MKKQNNNLRWIVLSIVVFLVDWLSKYYVAHHLAMGEPVSVLPFLNVMLAFNKGTAFSLLNQGATWQFWLLTGIAVVVSLTILIWLSQLSRQENWRACALALILGGAIGNVWDRIAYGHVIDFVDFHIGNWHFATFNIADAAITIGAIMLILEMFSNKK